MKNDWWEKWGREWAKILGILALIAFCFFAVASCQNAEKDAFLDCMDEAIFDNHRYLYYGDNEYNAVESDLVEIMAKRCYEERSITA